MGSNAKKLLRILDLAELSVNYLCPTRITKTSQTCLDIIAIPSSFTNFDYKVIEDASSDHFPVICILMDVGRGSLVPIRKRSFKNVDSLALRRRLHNIISSSLATSTFTLMTLPVPN